MKNLSKNSLGSMFFLCLWVSCSAQVQGSLHSEGSADLILKASLEPRAAALIDSLSRLGGGVASTPALDAQAISRSMSAAPGITALTLRNPNPTTLEGTIALLRADAFLAIPEKAGNTFIRYEQAPKNGGGKLRILLDRSSGPELLMLLSPEVRDYLSALMAPVATGETLTQKEYLALVQSVYGKGLAEEIASAKITLTIDFPGTISVIQGGKATKNRGAFTIPLGDLLVLERPLRYEVAWQ